MLHGKPSYRPFWDSLLLTCPQTVSVTPAQYFSRRRGLANGIVFAGGGLGGAVTSYGLDTLIQRFGPAWAYRILGIATLATGLPAAWFIRERTPIRTSSFVEWYAHSCLHQTDTNTHQAPLQRLRLPSRLPRRRHRHLPPFRAPLLHPPVQPLHGPLVQHGRGAPRGLQPLVGRRAHRVWDALRPRRVHQLALLLAGPHGAEHPRPVARVDHAGAPGRLRRRQRRVQRGVLRYHAHRRGQHVWVREGVGRHGHGCDGVGWGVSPGRSSCHLAGVAVCRC